jgi:acyl-homoserine lactone acylase PvdQ
VLPLLLLLALTASAETVDLIRDSSGTPHIFAKTTAGAAFGAGYAQAGDRPDALLKNLSSTSEPGELPPALRPLVDAFVAGVNQSLEAQSRSERIRSEQVAAYARRAFTWIKGSNDLLLGPTRSVSRAVIAVLDPIADWNAPDRPYEMSLYASDVDHALSGVAPVGMPFPVIGHNVAMAIGWSGDSSPGGPQSLEEAWKLITARTLADAKQALAMKQIRGQALIGTAAGEIYDSSGAAPTDGYFRRASPSLNGDAVAREQLRVQTTWSFGRAQGLAFSTDVFKADVWQRYLARVAPEDRFARRLISWNRRADADSIDALAFYEFKLAMERDASAVEPPDSLSLTRLRVALSRARDVMETQLDYNSTFGTLFRATRDNSRRGTPMGGGTLPEAGMETPRTLYFTRPSSADPRALHLVTAGQSATRIVELTRTPSAVSLLLPGESDNPESPYFDDQIRLKAPKRTFFRDRKELERSATSRKQLIF